MDDTMSSRSPQQPYTINFGHVDVDNCFTQAINCWHKLNKPALKMMLTLADEQALIDTLDKLCQGLYVHQEILWSQVDNLLTGYESAKTFLVSVIAFNSLDVSKVQYVVEYAVEEESSLEGLISALTFLPKKIVDPWLDRFIKSKDLIHKYVALSVFSKRKLNPQPYLSKIFERGDCRRHEKLFSCALKIIGEIKLLDCRELLYGDIRTDSSELAFWSMWSKAMLGDLNIISEMEGFVVHPGPMQKFAIDIVFRLAPEEYCISVISKMLGIHGNTRAVINASMVWGNIQCIPFLIQVMDIPLYARYAGRAFSYITGIDLFKKGLTLDVPVITELTFNQPNANASFIREIDENFSWPNVEKIKAVWQTYGNQFTKGQRLIHGKLISVEFIRELFMVAPLWQREMLEMELSAMSSRCLI